MKSVTALLKKFSALNLIEHFSLVLKSPVETKNKT